MPLQPDTTYYGGWQKDHRISSTGAEDDSTFACSARDWCFGDLGCCASRAVRIDELGREVPGAAAAVEHPRDDGAAERAAAPRRIALRQGECGVAARAIQGIRVGRANRGLQRPLSNADRARA